MWAGPDLIRIVDLMHRDKNIPKEVIEAALQLASPNEESVVEAPPGGVSRGLTCRP
jgi:hypothetical protein